MKGPSTPAARRAIALYEGAPRGDRFHVRARWWSCPFPAVERQLPAVGRILEVGSGHGLFSLYAALSSRDRTVVGVDIDVHKVALADDAVARLDPGEANVSFRAVEPGDLPDGPFDAIVINDVLYLMDSATRHDVLDACLERLGPDGVLVVKELDVAPRWKYEIGRFQEIVATRILRYTQGADLEIAPMSEFVDQLTAAGCSVRTERVDRGYPHPHQLIVARRSAT